MLFAYSPEQLISHYNRLKMCVSADMLLPEAMHLCGVSSLECQLPIVQWSVFVAHFTHSFSAFLFVLSSSFCSFVLIYLCQKIPKTVLANLFVKR